MPVLNSDLFTLQARRHLLQAPTPAPVPVFPSSPYLSLSLRSAVTSSLCF